MERYGQLWYGLVHNWEHGVHSKLEENDDAQDSGMEAEQENDVT